MDGSGEFTWSGNLLYLSNLDGRKYVGQYVDDKK